MEAAGAATLTGPHLAERRPHFIPGRPSYDLRTNLMRVEQTAWLGLVDAYARLADTPASHPSADLVRRDVSRWRQRWWSALQSLDGGSA